MSLAEKLSNAVGSKETDQLLQQVWLGFEQTEYYEALQMLLRNIEASALPALIGPDTPALKRAHAGGQFSVVTAIREVASFVTKFDPAKAEYADESIETETGDFPQESSQDFIV